MSRTLHLALTASLILSASAAFAKTKEGVTLPDEIEYAGKKLSLNGLGVREATIFNVKVYVAGLYLEKKSGDGAAIAASAETKRLVMRFVRDVDQGDLSDAYKEGFEKVGALESMKGKVDQLLKLMSDVKVGDELALSYVPDKGTVVELKGKERGVIAGADFAKALFSIWLGASPPNKGLKAGLLGG
ncbi:MAG: chalcone isomerase family protein [Myxococcota bacterium]